MASKNRRTGTTNASRAMTVVLEDIRSQFSVFGEALVGLRETMDRRFAELGERMDARFAVVDRRFEQVDQRFDQVGHRLGRLEGDVILLKAAVIENARDIREMRGTLTRIEAKLDEKVDRSELVR